MSKPKVPALDYERVKDFFYEKLDADRHGHGRMESAFFHTAQRPSGAAGWALPRPTEDCIVDGHRFRVPVALCNSDDLHFLRRGLRHRSRCARCWSARRTHHSLETRRGRRTAPIGWCFSNLTTKVTRRASARSLLTAVLERWIN